MTAPVQKTSRRARTLADLAPPPKAVKKAPAPELIVDDRPAVVGVNVFMTEADRRRLKQISLDSGESVQKLVRDGIDRMLRARGHSALEPATANVPSGLRRKKADY